MNSNTPNYSLKLTRNKEFMNSLNEKVNAILPGNTKRDVLRQYLKALLIFTWFLASYVALFFTTNSILSVLLCISLGFSLTGIGFNIFHDAVHGSFSNNQTINKTLSFISCSVIGVSRILWKHKHNYLHHQFPNIQFIDDDLETRGNLRLSPHQAQHSKFKFQHIYAPIMYGMTTIEWIFIKDFKQYFSEQLNEFQSLPKFKPIEHFEFFLSKLIYLIVFIIIPLTHFNLIQLVIGLFIANFSMSLILTAIFQLAHVMEQSKFPLATDPKLKEAPLDWTELQLSTTVNFATKNALVTWYAGGLNYQVEHHLFPNISHAHYPAIAPLLEETAKEFGLPYHSIDTYWEAIKNHFRILKSLGSDPQTII